jgi:hypothetical protein
MKPKTLRNSIAQSTPPLESSGPKTPKFLYAMGHCGEWDERWQNVWERQLFDCVYVDGDEEGMI